MLEERDRSHPKMAPESYLACLQETATFVFTRGAPFFVPTHLKFVDAYLHTFAESGGKRDELVRVLTEAGPAPRSTRWAMTGQRSRLSRRGLVVVLLWQLAKVFVVQFSRSLVKTALGVLRNGVRSVPPLITAVVVVFVTSDAWRILSSGFPGRFAALVMAFVVAAVVFLEPWHWWRTDVEVEGDELEELLLAASEGHRPAAATNTAFEGSGPSAEGEAGGLRFVDLLRVWSVRPVPLVKPKARIERAAVLLGYLSLIVMFLTVVTAVVSFSLVVIGLILVDTKGTMQLAQSSHVYLPLPGHLVITRELVAVSVSLGAFAAFFLVAAQSDATRRSFMRDLLKPLRTAMLVYTVYCHVHDNAAEWTGVDPGVPPLAAGVEMSWRRRKGSGLEDEQAGTGFWSMKP